MDTLRDDLLAYWNESVVERAGAFIGRTLVSFLALLVLLLIARFSLRAARRALGRTRAHANARLLVDRMVQFTFILLAAAWVLSIYGVQFTALLAVLGAGALAVSLLAITADIALLALQRALTSPGLRERVAS